MYYENNKMKSYELKCLNTFMYVDVLTTDLD